MLRNEESKKSKADSTKKDNQKTIENEAAYQKISYALKEVILTHLSLNGWEFVSWGETTENGSFKEWSAYKKNEVEIELYTNREDHKYFKYKGPEAEFKQTKHELSFRIPEINLDKKSRNQ